MAEKPNPDLDTLLRYRQKRDFSRTPEPDAAVPGSARTPGEAATDLGFVVQQHRATRMHWDFRLEADGVLMSWAVPKGPSLNTKDKRMAAQTEDHPYDYGGFEGVIAKGNYGAGEVIVWDTGVYTPDEGGELSWGDREAGSRRMRADLAAGKMSFTLRGQKLHGSWTLVRIGRDPAGKDWLLIKHRDEFASARDVLEDDRSVLSGVTIKDLQAGRMPAMSAQSLGGAPHAAAVEAPLLDARTLRPMLPTLIEKPFSRDGWLFEPKLDGVRTLAFVRDGKVELRTRRGNPATAQYPEVVAALAAQPVRSAVFDGEIVAYDEHGVPEFQAIQQRINLSRPAEVERIAAEIPVYYYIFDLLYLDGYDLRRVPLAERKTLLSRTLLQGPQIKYVEHVRDDGVAMHAGAIATGFEGIVGKRANSIYEADTRSRLWLKVKDGNEQEFVVGGYTEGEGSRRKTFGGLLVGYYEGDELRFASSVGSGLTDAMLSIISARLAELKADEAPFVNPPSVIGGRGAGGKSARCYWVRPEIVVQVKYNAWTRDGNLRAPVFAGLRDDIDPRSVRREDAARQEVDVIVGSDEPREREDDDLHALARSVCDQLDAATKDDLVIEVAGVPLKVTNLSKVFWPATGDTPPRTKADLIRYYARVAPYLVPHLRDRPLTLTRYPNGIDGKSFYQKHWTQPFPKEFHVDCVTLYSSHNEGDGDYVLVNNFPTLIWLAQLADIEMHASMARIDPAPDALRLSTTFAGSEVTLEASVLNYPDYMVFDLDPYIYAGNEKKGEEPALNRRAFEKTREIAFSLKDLLQQLRLSSFVKTTGKTGLHIYVPVLRQYTYTELRAAAEAVGRYMLQMHPNDLTMEWAVPKRTGKIFFDHGQNARGKTLAAQYSLRPSPHAAVSAPVTWDELKRVYPTDFDIETGPARFDAIGDLWADILASKQDLKALIEPANG